MTTETGRTPRAPAEHEIYLKNIGFILMLVGLIDGLSVLYSAWRGTSYTSNLYVAALLGGIMLTRGSLFAAQVATVAAGFFMAAIVGMTLASPFFMPLDLIRAQFHVDPSLMITGAVRGLLILALLVWMLRRLTHGSILEAMRQHGTDVTRYWRKPVIGFVLGFSVPLLQVMTYLSTTAGVPRDVAIAEAKKRVGPEYKIHVLGIEMAPGSDSTIELRGHVVAYTPTSIKPMVLTLHPPSPLPSAK